MDPCTRNRQRAVPVWRPLGAATLCAGLALCVSCASNKVLLVVADQGFDDLQYTIAWARLEAAGYETHVATVTGSAAVGGDGLVVPADLRIADADAEPYAGLLLLGGAGSRSLQGHPPLLSLCAAFGASDKVVGALEFAPVVLARAGLLAGMTTTGWPTESGALEAMGARYDRKIAVRSGNVVTGLGGSDQAATAFVAEYLDELSRSRAFLGIGRRVRNPDLVLRLDDTRTRFVMTHSGRTRTGSLFIPPTYDGRKPFSLVLALHGQAGTGRELQVSRDLDTTAADLDFVVVYPDGYNRDWEILPRAETQIDDAGYFRALIAALGRVLRIDPKRVYVTGHSLGGFMAYRLAYDISDLLAAIAPVAGLVYTPHSDWDPPRPVSILHQHALDDGNVPFYGDVFTREQVYLNPIPVLEGIDFWRALNDATGDGWLYLDRDGIQGTLWASADGTTDVALVVHPRGGHTWLPRATETIADFFYNHPSRRNSLRIDYHTLQPYSTVGEPIRIGTQVTDPAGVRAVTFLANAQAMGRSTAAPFTYVWNDAQPGQYRITARAELRDGAVLPSTLNETIRVVRPDLARGKTALSSSREAADLGPENAVDGNPLTRWASVAGDPQWIEIDLGRPIAVDGLTLIWEAAYAAVYEVRVSQDRVRWTTVHSTATGAGGMEILAFSPVAARYVTVHGTARATQWGYSLWDVMVHGPETQ